MRQQRNRRYGNEKRLFTLLQVKDTFKALEPYESTGSQDTSLQARTTRAIALVVTSCIAPVSSRFVRQHRSCRTKQERSIARMHVAFGF
ncbi:unnamed protein product [Gongylonema pulchrum]|uniref:Homeobox domain-containing protein n=1 Tax=Gongylonema pulchrum TaxID=637853 RepID=A0A183EYE5_9BILA|nr:unnamed protein product [Gongylonema pulchrum]